MNIPVPDNGIPVKLGDPSYVYKNVYHPIIWINELPYRPRVETLIIKDGTMVYLRLKKDKGSSGIKGEYELPGGSIDADSSKIEQAENEVNEESLMSIKDIYDAGIQYYENYPDGFIMGGGDTPLEYKGHISDVFVAQYNGIYNKFSVEEKDLDPKIANNGKFYRIMDVAKLLKKEHYNALLNSPYVKSSVKSALRILSQMMDSGKLNDLKDIPSSDITDELIIVSNYDKLTQIQCESAGKDKDWKKVSVFRSIKNAVEDFFIAKPKSMRKEPSIWKSKIMYVYAVDEPHKELSLYTPTNEECPCGKITGELWLKTTSNVKIKRLGMIQVTTKGNLSYFYGGKDNNSKFEVLKCNFKWIIKDIVEKVALESVSPVVPGNKLYHGTTYEISKFEPRSLNLGNAMEEPGWVTFAFADYTLALRFGLMRAIQKAKDYWGKDITCTWDMIESKPAISVKDFNEINYLIPGFRFFVYTIDATNLDVGIGNDDRLPEYTFSESEVIPEKEDILRIDIAMVKEHLIIIPNAEIKDWKKNQEKMARYGHPRGWYGAFMTREYNTGSASHKLQKACWDGKLNPGDDIQEYMNTHGISFDDDTVPMGVKNPCQVITEGIVGSHNMYFLSEIDMNGKILTPRIPNNFMTKNGYEDATTKRVCFATSIDGALMGLSQNMTGKQLFVHMPAKGINRASIIRPTKEQVPDSRITKEIWYTKPVELKCIGKITVNGDRGLPGHKYTYGNNSAELYDWDWSWTDKSAVNESTIYHDTPMKSTLEKDFKKKPHKNLSSFKKIPITKYSVDKYKDKVEQVIRKLNPEDRGYIFMDGDDFVAVVAVDDRKDDVGDLKDYNWITDIAVSPKYRGCGLSKQLLDIATGELKGDFLTVTFDNEVAINLYKSYGFKIGKNSYNDIMSGKSKSKMYTMFYKDRVKGVELVNESAIPVTENLLISKGVFDVNFEDFESGKSNVVLVTGLSGSGKTTLGTKIANKYGAELIELDCFECCYQFENDEQLKQAGDVFWQYLSGHKKLWDRLKERSIRGKELGEEIDKFLQFAISWCKKDKNTKYVIEGVQIYAFLNKEKISGTPLLIVGTSMLKSIVRRLSRTRSISKEKFKKELSELPQCIAWYIDEDKQFEKFKKSVLESTVETDSSISYSTNKNHVVEIIDSLPMSEKKFIGNHVDEGFSEQFVSHTKNLKYREVLLSNGEPVAFLDVYTMPDMKDTEGTIVLAVKSGGKYRRKGYGSTLVDRMENCITQKTGITKLTWEYNNDNVKSGMMGLTLGYKGVDNKFSKTLENVQIEESSVTEAAEYSNTNKYPVFITLMHTGTKTATVIKKVTGDEFSHATISFNIRLSPQYSFGTKKLGGKERGLVIHGTRDPFYDQFKTTYAVYVMYVSRKQREKMLSRLQYFIDHESTLKYDTPALAACYLHIPTEFRKKYFCSRFVMEIIGEGQELSKVPSLWKPQEITSLNNITLVNAGDDFRRYDYKITSANLKLIQENHHNKIHVEIPVSEASRSKLPKDIFGLPNHRKYPLDTEKHVKSAIKFFNYVSPDSEEELAQNILKRMDELGMDAPAVTKRNRFIKYMEESYQQALRNTSKQANWSLINTLPDDERRKALKAASEYVNDIPIYTNAAYLGKELAATINIFRDHEKESTGRAFIHVNSKFADFAELKEDLMIEAELEFTDPMWGIECTTIMFMNGREFDMWSPNVETMPTVKQQSVFDGFDGHTVIAESTASSSKSMKITKYTGFVDSKGVWNGLVVINGENYRHRVECLVLDGSKIFLSTRDDGSIIVPGGSVERNVPNDVQCANECKEEARLIVKNVRNSGEYYIEKTGMPRWAIEMGLPMTWVGRYTEIYVAQYDKKYTGHIDDIDIDPVNAKGKFYDIKSVYNKLRPEWQRVLEPYLLESVTESCKDLKSARKFVSEVRKLAQKYDANFFVITDGASGYHNTGNPAVKNARNAQIEWEKQNGFDPDEDWSKDGTLESTDIFESGDFDGYAQYADLNAAREDVPVSETWIPLMEAPRAIDKNATGDSAEDYTANVEESEDEKETPEEEESQEEGTDDFEVEEPTDYTSGTEDTEGDDTTDANSADDGGFDSSDTSNADKNGNLFDNNVLKNYSLLKNFEKLYELTKEVSDSLDAKVEPTKLQNAVLAQVLKNLSSIREFIVSYVKFQFSQDNYSQNLYYYKIVVQSLKLNLELLKRNQLLGETK